MVQHFCPLFQAASQDLTSETKANSQHVRRLTRRPVGIDKRQQRAREGRVGLTCEFGRQRRQRPLPGRVHRRAMLGKLRLEAGEPLPVGGRHIGEQLAARAWLIPWRA